MRQSVSSPWLVGVAVALGSCGGKSSPKGDKDDWSTGSAPPVVFVDRADGRDFDPEKEPNDQSDNASPLLSGAGIAGVLDTYEDVDWYLIKATEPGHLSVRLDGLTTADAVLEVVEKSRPVAKSDRGGSAVAEGIRDWPISGDTLVKVSIYQSRRKPKEFKADKYRLAVDVRDDTGEEQLEVEPNADEQKAGGLLVGFPVKGYIGWNGDQDAWRLRLETVSEEQRLDISLLWPGKDKFTATVLNEQHKTVLTRTYSGAGEFMLTGLSMAAIGSTSVFYVVVQGKRAEHRQPYEIKVTEHLEPEAHEQEPNDDIAHATAITGDEGVFRGHLDTADNDLFTYTGGVGTLQLSISRKDVTVETSRDGQNWQASMVETVDGGAVHLRITSSSTASYELTWTLTAAPVGEGSLDGEF